MKKLFYCTAVVLFISVGFYSCDTTTAPDDLFKDAPTISVFTITPNEITFTVEDGYKDTTVSINVVAQFINIEALSEPVLVIADKYSGETIGEKVLELFDSDENSLTYTTDFHIVTSTTARQEYVVNLLYDDRNGAYAQAYVNISGFSNAVPIILETSSPDTIQRPSSGEVPATFTATVTDDDGQESIDKVYLRVINQASGEVEGSPFQMFDDGMNYEDEVAGDSVYTWSLPVTPTDNNPNRNFDIEFYAVDQGGMVSDTVKTTFSITE